jgi:hypothetical protein
VETNLDAEVQVQLSGEGLDRGARELVGADVPADVFKAAEVAGYLGNGLEKVSQRGLSGARLRY